MATKYDKDIVEKAILAANGNLLLVAQKLGISRQCVYNYVDRFGLEPTIKAGRESLVDLAEHKLSERVQEGDTTAIIFTLKTQGKRRGYVERQEITGTGSGGAVKIESDATPEEAAVAYQNMLSSK